MKTFALVFASLAVLAACGGKSKGGAAPAPGPASAGDDPATPFDDGAVRAALAATPGVSNCGVEPSTTMGAHFAAQRDGLVGGGDTATAVDERFGCKAADDGSWDCEWSVFTKPSAPDPEDPCAEGGGSGYIIMVKVGADGTLMADQINCNAPG